MCNTSLTNLHVDFFFFKFELLEYSLFLDSCGFTPLKEYVKTLNIVEQALLFKEINTEFLWSFEPHELIEQHPESLDFFSTEENNLIMEGTILLNQTKPNCLKNARSIKYKINVVPRKISLPINSSFAVFEVEDHSNKKYRADFKNDTDYFSIGYLDKKLVVDFGLKKRRFWRLAGSTMHLNTIIPEGTEIDTDTCLQYIAENHLGEFDLSKLV